jgi:argininosuccinate synthase
MWFTSHWMDLMTYVRSTQRHVTGTVTMRLHKGTATVVGRRSAHSLYSRELMTYSAASTFNQGAAKSFLEIYGLQAITDAARQMRDAAQMRSIPSERPTAPTSLLPPPPTLA